MPYPGLVEMDELAISRPSGITPRFAPARALTLCHAPSLQPCTRPRERRGCALAAGAPRHRRRARLRPQNPPTKPGYIAGSWMARVNEERNKTRSVEIGERGGYFANSIRWCVPLFWA